MRRGEIKKHRTRIAQVVVTVNLGLWQHVSWFRALKTQCIMLVTSKLWCWILLCGVEWFAGLLLSFALVSGHEIVILLQGFQLWLLAVYIGLAVLQLYIQFLLILLLYASYSFSYVLFSRICKSCSGMPIFMDLMSLRWINICYTRSEGMDMESGQWIQIWANLINSAFVHYLR